MPFDNRLRNRLPSEVIPRQRRRWVNWHENIEQSIDAYFDIQNPAGNSIDTYNATTAHIQALIDLARTQQVALRPFGAGWSFSDAPASPGWMVDTAYLNLMFPMSDARLDATLRR